MRDVQERYSVLLQQYLKHSGSHRIDLGHQMFVTKKLQIVRAHNLRRLRLRWSPKVVSPKHVCVVLVCRWVNA